MDYIYHFDLNKNLVIHEIVGVLNAEMLKYAVASGMEKETFRPDLDVIFDFRGITSVNISREDVENLREYVISIQPELGEKFKVAFVSDDDEIFGLSRMYHSISESFLPFKMNSFRNLDEAYDWLSQSA